MHLSSSATLLKYLLNALCWLTMIAAVGVISFGVLAFGDSGFVSGAYFTAAMVYVIILVAIFGCCAALRGSNKLSRVFITVTVICIIFELIYMACYASMKDTFVGMTAERVQELWTNEQRFPGIMDGIQRKYKCCGKDGPQDYAGVLPKSCCNNNDCSYGGNFHPKGCAIMAMTLFEKYSENLFYCLMGLIGVQVLDVLCAFFYDRSILTKKNKAISIAG